MQEESEEELVHPAPCSSLSELKATRIFSMEHLKDALKEKQRVWRDTTTGEFMVVLDDV